jgi:hypothetical protein
MPSLITEKSRVLVELPVAILVRIADGDGKMTAREMERVHPVMSGAPQGRDRHQSVKDALSK